MRRLPTLSLMRPKMGPLILCAVLINLIGGQPSRCEDLIVSSTSDSGLGTLREALAVAQSGDRVVFDFASNSTINIASDLPEITVDLSFVTRNSVDVTIDLNGSSPLTLSSGVVDPTGLIIVNGDSGQDLLVNPNATAIGDGVFQGNAFSTGSISPGSSSAVGSLGTFDVDGDIELNSGRYLVDLDASGGTTDSDLIIADTATIGNASLAFRFSGDQFAAGQSFLILDAATLNGTFANQMSTFAIDNRPFLELFDISAGNQVQFEIRDNGVPFASVVTGCNQQIPVAIFESLRGTGNATVDALVNSSADAVNEAANQVSGSIYPTLLGAEVIHIQNNIESVRDRVVQQYYSGFETSGMMPWIRGYGVSATVGEDHCQTPGYYESFGGAELGFSLSTKQGWSSHVFSHLGGGELRLSGVDQRSQIESYRGGVSVEYAGELAYAMACAGAGTQSYDVFRSFSQLEGATSAQGSVDGSSQFGYFETGTVFCWEDCICMPYLGLHATNVDLDPVNETGDETFRISNSGGSTESIRGVLGMGMDKYGPTYFGRAGTRIRFGWLHEYRDANTTLVSTLAEPAITTSLIDRGVDPGIDWGFLRVQVDWFQILGGQASLSYQGQANSRSSFNSLAGGIHWLL